MKFLTSNFKSSKFSRMGFTLVEVLVAIGLFVVAVFISLGAIIGLLDANNKSQTLFSATSNLNYALESMTRTIRFGNTYHCEMSADYSGSVSSPKDCGSGGSFLAVNTGTQTVRYRILNNSIERSDGVSAFKKIIGSDIVIDLNKSKFYVLGTTVGDNFQPRVIMVVKGYSGAKQSSKTSFDVETTVSQMELDI